MLHVTTELPLSSCAPLQVMSALKKEHRSSCHRVYVWVVVCDRRAKQQQQQQQRTGASVVRGGQPGCDASDPAKPQLLPQLAV
jgi:hypothetical protein